MREYAKRGVLTPIALRSPECVTCSVGGGATLSRNRMTLGSGLSPQRCATIAQLTRDRMDFDALGHARDAVLVPLLAAGPHDDGRVVGHI